MHLLFVVTLQSVKSEENAVITHIFLVTLHD